MEIDVSQQLFQLGASWLSGFTVGGIYDVFRVLRRKLKASALLDGLFSIAALCTLFTLGMDAGGGSLHIFMLAFFALGFASYMLLLSDIVLKVLNKTAELIAAVLAPTVNTLKIIARIIKKYFSNANIWFRMKAEKMRKGRKKAVEKDTLHSGDSADRAGHICYPEPRDRNGQLKRGRIGNGGAQGAAYAGTGGKRKAQD